MKRFLTYFLFALVAFVIVQTPWKVFQSEKLYGWDHQIYCKAIEIGKQGINPYLVENLGSSLSYTYPALFLKIYEPLCGSDSRAYIWVQFGLLMFIVALLVFFLKTDLFFTAAWVFLGFNGAYANYTTGNIGVFEAWFFAIFLVLYSREKWWSTIFLVPSAFLKVVPSLMVLPAMLRKPFSWKWAVSAAATAGIAVVVLNVLSYLYSPELYKNFFIQILGLNSSQHSPIAEVDSNPSNLTIPLFLKNLSSILWQDCWGAVFVVLALGLLAFSFWLWDKNIRHQKNQLIAVCWSFLVLMLWLPRLKPYSMVIVCIALLPILSKKSKALSFGLLLLSIFHRSLNGDKADPTWDFFANNTAIYTYIAVLIFLSLKKELKA